MQILITTDFSANAENAMNYAIYLFEKNKCTFHVLNTYTLDTAASIKKSDPHTIVVLKNNSEANIKKVIRDKKLNNTNPLHTFKGLSINDTLVNAIGRISIDKDIDYLFMGTKGSSGTKGVYMGSNTVKVVLSINFCPIVAVPERYFYDIPDQIVFATNFEHAYTNAELLPLKEIAKLWHSKIVVIHVNRGKKLSEQQEKSKRLLSEKLGKLPHSFIEMEGYSQISKSIMTYSKNHASVGIIAMINKDHSFFYKLIKENVIKNLAFHTQVPFLVLPFID